jgi:hypothetical protein
MATEHRQVWIRGCGQEAEVDEGIAPLIKEMWRAGIRTFMSCQEGAHGFVWLNFDDPQEALRFLNVVAVYNPDPDSMYKRMLGHDYGKPNNWIYDVDVKDICLLGEFVDGRDEIHEGQPYMTISFSIWFPPSDLPAVMERFAEWRNVKKMSPKHEA